jgi:hypothetical protein
MLHHKAQGNPPFDARRQPVSESQLQGTLAYLKMLNVAQWEKIISTEMPRTDSNGG